MHMRVLGAGILAAWLILTAGCAGTGPGKPATPRRLHTMNYVWVYIDSIAFKSGGMVRQIDGRTIDECDAIARVDSLMETVLTIQLRDDGRWYLPPNVFYRTEELRPKRVYKVMFDYADAPPTGTIVVSPHDM
jgi:hypothetical protein